MKLMPRCESETQEKIYEDAAIHSVLAEMKTATDRYGTFHSTHEAYGVLREEVDELWADIKGNDLVRMRYEAIQVAAMAIRLVIDAERTMKNGGN